jgi:hypothetical protein
MYLFSVCHLIRAMRSYDPFLADVLRHAHLKGKLEFQEVKNIIAHKKPMTEDMIIGSKTWLQWKTEYQEDTFIHVSSREALHMHHSLSNRQIEEIGFQQSPNGEELECGVLSYKP